VRNYYIELLEGCLVKKTSRNPPHDSTLQRLFRKLWPLLPDGWDLRIRMAIALDRSEPEPDAAIVREGDYDTAHPTSTDIACVAEVSDSSLSIDRSLKTQIYADAGIPVYLIVNVCERCAELYELPVGSVYTRIARFAEADALPLPVAGRVLTLAVEDLLPR